MKWSIYLGRIAGIRVQMHVTFLLLLPYFGYRSWETGGTIAAALSGVLFVLAIFGCVVLHELGHALTARRFGIGTRDITLLPIGGVARLERMPDEPAQELWVALAGPAVNVVIAGVLGGWLAFTGLLQLSGISLIGGSFLASLFLANVILVAFNLLPAFPMDGGRVLRALLATSLEYSRATRIAATVGQGMAIVFVVVGLVISNGFLLLIALFVWIGAQQEASMAQIKFALSGIPVHRAMLTDFRVLEPADPLSHAVNIQLTGSQKDYPVVDHGQVVGVLMQSDLQAAVAQGSDPPVSAIMRRDFGAVDAHEMLETVLVRLREGSCSTLPVLQDGRLVGLVTLENVGKFLSVQAAQAKATRT